MVSSAQNSSGVHWCRRRVRSKVPEKVWEALVQQGSGEGSEEGLGGFGAETGFWKFRNRFRRRFQEALVQSPVRFNRVPEKVPERVPGRLGAKPSQVQQISGEGSGEGRGGFGAEPEQGSRMFQRRPRRVRFNRVRFNRVPE